MGQPKIATEPLSDELIRAAVLRALEVIRPTPATDRAALGSRMSLDVCRLVAEVNRLRVKCGEEPVGLRGLPMPPGGPP